MRTDLIRAQISAAWQEETATRRFAALVRQQLTQAGAHEIPADSQTVREIVGAWRSQLESIPDLLDAIRMAGERAGIADTVRAVVDAAEGYFLDGDDVLPDDQGVLGLLDDMYLALSLVHQVSERYRDATGHPLLEVDLREPIAAVRPLFRGQRLIALDERVRAALRQPQILQAIDRLATLPTRLSIPGLAATH